MLYARRRMPALVPGVKRQACCVERT